MPKNCESKPFIKLQEDNSNAPILNYNMEQENCLNVFANVEVPIKQSLFKPKEVAIPIAYTLKDLEESEIKQILIEELKKNNSAYFGGFGLIQNATLPIIFYEANASSQPYQPVTEALRQSTFPTLPATPLSRPEPLYNNTNGAWSFVVATKGNQSFAKFGKVQVFVDEPVMGRVQNPNDPFGNIGAYIWETRIVGQKDTIEFPQDAVVDFDIMDIVAHIKQGKLPSFVSKSMGKIVIEYTNFNPDTMKDKIISIQYETMLCSYLGNYGAGRTVNTFSLLPGEKSTITMRTYRDSVRSNSLSENILDSMSEASSNSLQRSFESQKGNNTDINLAVSSGSTSTDTSNWNAGGGLGLDLGFFSIGGGGGGGGTNTTTNTNLASSSFHTSTISNLVNNGMNQHVSESNKHRDVNINTTTTNTETSGEENSVVRELININKSRTLNFVFRQLHQEHIVIHWLKNIKFRFYDPNTRQNKLVFSQNLPSLLREVLKDQSAVNEVFNAIMSSVGYIFNYNETPIKFFESRNFETPVTPMSCDGVTLKNQKDCLWLRTKGLKDTYANITVNGVILGVQTHTMRTPSVIVDSLLGQGEALDCYNQQLQGFAVEQAEIQTNLMRQSYEIIEKIDDPIKKAEMYKKVVGDCCDVPQSGCGCITCKDKE